jgi:vanillate O-demethylase ferredoxin subunit
LTGLPADSRRDGVYRIAVKRAAAGRGGSRFMAGLLPGEHVAIAGPDNHFELPLAAPHLLLVAGGIGITALSGMALTLAARGASFRLCQAAREPAELVFGPTLQEALGERLQRYVGSAGQRLDLAAEIDALPPGSTMLVCGPMAMLQAAQSAWAAAGRPAADLRFETFGSGGARPAESFWVRVPRHDLELVVPPDRSLLDVLAEHGVQALHDCRRGECGLCALDVLEVKGEIDHRDVFFSPAQKQANRQLCTCVSRVCGGGIVIDSPYRPDTL